MRVKQIMSHPAVSCGPDDTLETAAGLMWDHSCGVLPVVEDGRVIGMLTDRDTCMAAYTERRLLSDIPVSRAMAAHVVTCGPDDTVKHAEELMAAHQVRRLPVVHQDGTLVGVLSIDDLVREGAEERWQRRKAISAAELVDTLASVAEPRIDEMEE
jgi:CBS domain-containing protein